MPSVFSKFVEDVQDGVYSASINEIGWMWLRTSIVSVCSEPLGFELSSWDTIKAYAEKLGHRIYSSSQLVMDCESNVYGDIHTQFDFYLTRDSLFHEDHFEFICSLKISTGKKEHGVEKFEVNSTLPKVDEGNIRVQGIYYIHDD